MPREPVAGLALICDTEGIILECRRDDIGIAAGGVRDRSFASLLDASSLDRAAEMFLEVRDRSASFNYELLVRMPGGGTETLHAMAGRVGRDRIVIIGAVSPTALLGMCDELMTMNNEQTNLVRSMWDETRGSRVEFDEFTRMNNELATTQRALMKTNAALERADRDKNRLIGMATHDLRNPLGVIRSLSDILLDPDIPLEMKKRRELLQRIRRSSDFMLALIDEMLELTAIDSGEFRLDLECVDIGAVVRDTLDIQSVLADEKDISVSVDVPSDLPQVRADPRRIEQVLYNIIGNAIKFSPRGRPIDVFVSVDDEAGDGASYLRVSVRDRGPGIPTEELDRLFQPFARTSVQASGGEASTGLGLAIAARIVSAHNGRIRCDTEVGVGTTFHIDLPIAE